MGIKGIIEKVEEIRCLNTEEDIEFERLIGKIKDKVTIKDLGKLCRVLDDDTEHPEVMFVLLHEIENIYSKQMYEGLKYIVESLKENKVRSKEWYEIIFYRAMNDEESLEVLREVYKKLDEGNKVVLKGILKEIKEEDSQLFGCKVDYILHQ